MASIPSLLPFFLPSLSRRRLPQSAQYRRGKQWNSIYPLSVFVRRRHSSALPLSPIAPAFEVSLEIVLQVARTLSLISNSRCELKIEFSKHTTRFRGLLRNLIPLFSLAALAQVLGLPPSPPPPSSFPGSAERKPFEENEVE